MPRFTPVIRDASTAMAQRAELLSRPPEFFKPFFGGRTPALDEKLFWIEEAVARMTTLQVFSNGLYLVELASLPPFIRVSIRRHDGQPCREWRHFQQIKNELIGPEFEAVELFPAESRLIDTCNQYHLWIYSDPGYRFPFGFTSSRFTIEQSMPAMHCTDTQVPQVGQRM